LLVTLVATLVVIYPSPARAAHLRLVDARKIVERIDRGLLVNESNVEIRGPLRLPGRVAVPLLIRNSKIDGAVSGGSTNFSGPVDLSGTTITGRLRLPYADFRGPFLMLGTSVGRGASFDFARFDQSTLLNGAHIAGKASFKGSVFRGPARFAPGYFLSVADFRLAEFDDLASFEVAQFEGASSFANAAFRSSADFTAAGFSGPASFSGARFFDGADFGGSYFLASAALSHTHFDRDTNFRRAKFFHGARFSAATASAVLDFDGALFRGGPIDFSSAQLADAEFSGGEKTGAATEFDEPAVFDQATIEELNLDGAVLASTLLLPDPRGIGGISNLRMDPADVGHIRAVASVRKGGSVHPSGTRSARERALALIETAARSGGDLAAANQAEIRRLTLERQDEGPIRASLDWTLGWEIGGYLVRPWHPFFALLAFFVLAALVRSWKARHDRRGLKARVRGFAKDLWQSVNAIWRFNPGDGGAGRVAEQFITKFLVLAFVLSVGNAEPGVSPIVKGILP
jgi:uncharacterized protein YjbI with pentapeptide repeats